MTRAIRSRATRCNTATGRHLAALSPRITPCSGVSTLDSIQCHSISQCNAHAAAYRCVSPVKRPPFPAGASRVKCPTCNRSVHQGTRARARANMGTSVNRFYTQISFFSYTLSLIHGRARAAPISFRKPLSGAIVNARTSRLQPLPLISARTRR